MREIEEILIFAELLAYGSSTYISYDSGMKLESLIPSYHNKIYGAGFFDPR